MSISKNEKETLYVKNGQPILRNLKRYKVKCLSNRYHCVYIQMEAIFFFFSVWQKKKKKQCILQSLTPRVRELCYAMTKRSPGGKLNFNSFFDFREEEESL